MHRQWSAFRRHLRIRSGPHACVGVSLGTFGIWFFSRNHIFADSPNFHSITFGEAQPVLKLSYAGDAAGGSGFIQGNTGIARFDYTSIPNKSPGWCSSYITSVALPSGTSWTLFSVYEGFDGWDCMAAVSSRLLRDVLDSLTEILSQYVPLFAEHAEIGAGTVTSVNNLEPEQSFSEAADRAIKKAFLDLDYGIVHQPLNVILASDQPPKVSVSRVLGTALTGSSALLSFYDQESRELKMALTGDSRAILGRRCKSLTNDTKTSSSSSPSYEAHILTTEQTWQNPHELARLHDLHPTEPTLPLVPSLTGGGGIPMTRAFGLAAYKWGVGLQERLHREFFDADMLPLPEVKTPPYVTAEPEITTIKVEPGDFLVLATSGLWKSLTNEQVVGLVGLWLDRGMHLVQDDSGAEHVAAGGRINEMLTFELKDLPVNLEKQDETVMHARWRTQKRFVCVDYNAAMHLSRNALGGADEDLMSALLTIKPPRAAKYREDLNVTVIFFDN